MKRLPNTEHHSIDLSRIEELSDENTILRRDVNALSETWVLMSGLLSRISSSASHLDRILDEGEFGMDQERKKWVANCAPF